MKLSETEIAIRRAWGGGRIPDKAFERRVRGFPSGFESLFRRAVRGGGSGNPGDDEEGP